MAMAMVVKLFEDEVELITSGGRQACHALALEMADNWAEYLDPDCIYDEAVQQAIAEWGKASEKS